MHNAETLLSGTSGTTLQIKQSWHDQAITPVWGKYFTIFITSISLQNVSIGSRWNENVILRDAHTSWASALMANWGLSIMSQNHFWGQFALGVNPPQARIRLLLCYSTCLSATNPRSVCISNASESSPADNNCGNDWCITKYAELVALPDKKVTLSRKLSAKGGFVISQYHWSLLLIMVEICMIYINYWTLVTILHLLIIHNIQGIWIAQ